jgi:DNA-binding transcriptional MerR regulator
MRSVLNIVTNLNGENMKKEFLHRDVMKIFTWIKSRTLMSWTERGLLTPTFGDAAGPGTSRRYAFPNLIEIAFINELLSYGMAFSMIKIYINQKIYKEMIESQNWDMIFWVKREELPSKGLSADKSAPFIETAGLSACSDFHKKAGELLFNFVRVDDTHSISMPSITSVFAVNFHSLNDFVSKRIEDIDS